MEAPPLAFELLPPPPPQPAARKASAHTVIIPAASATRLHCFVIPSLPSGLDRERVLRSPLEADAATLLLEHALGRGLEVLADNGQLPSPVELDQVARDHSGVDDVADAAGLVFHPGLPLVVLGQHVNLLGAHREAAPAPLDDVRDADKAGDELGLRVLVGLLRRRDPLDPSRVQ